MKDMSTIGGPLYNNTIPSSGNNLGLTYNNWDANSVTMCNCDGGYFEADCSKSKLIFL